MAANIIQREEKEEILRGPGFTLYRIRSIDGVKKSGVVKTSTHYCLVNNDTPDDTESYVTVPSGQVLNLLTYLVNHRNENLSQDTILRDVFNDEPIPGVENNSIGTVFTRLKDLLNEVHPLAGERIITVDKKILTYRFEASNEECFMYEKERLILSEKLFPVHSEIEEAPLLPDEGFVERDKVTALIDQMGYDYPVISITGRPATGKSTFLRNFIRSHAKKVLAYFFCKWDVDEASSACHVIKKLSYQMMMKDDNYCCRLSSSLKNISKEDLLKMSPADLFSCLFTAPIKGLTEPVSGYIVIDALDECEDSDELLRQIRTLLSYLPAAITLLISSRNALTRVLDKQYCKTIRIDSAENRGDIKTYLMNRIPEKKEEDISRLARICGSNFMYAKYLCDSANADGDFPGLFPPKNDNSLYQYYYGLFRQKFPAGYNSTQARILSVLLALRTPASLDLLCQILSLSHGEMTQALENIMDILNDEAYPGHVTFYHKSISDWLFDTKEAAEYALTLKSGCNIVFNYICQELQEENEVPYTVFKDWSFYGKEAGSKDFKRMINDKDLLIETVRQHRLHGDYARAMNLAAYHQSRHKNGSLQWFRFGLAYSDVMFDLRELEAAEKIMSDLWTMKDCLAEEDLPITIELYQNLAWLEMEKLDYSASCKHYEEVLKMYDRIEESSEKDNRYSHCLYVYSTVLFRDKQYEASTEMIDEALRIRRFLQDTRSLEYAIMLKMHAWNMQKKDRYDDAGKDFTEALQVQTELFKDQPKHDFGPKKGEIPISQYLAHTYKSFAENDLVLYERQHDKNVFRRGLTCIEIAIGLYGCYQDIRFKRQKTFCEMIKEKYESLAKGRN